MSSLQKIRHLSEFTVSQIAAGEVIEHPGSIIKELIENSIDAGANQIEIFVKGGGFESIQVRDNGHGIYKDDLSMAIKSFATSKLSKIDDLLNIQSFGFRGEALGAITSAANISLESKTPDQDISYKIIKQVGCQAEISPASLPHGTRIIVSDLFHKLPVRKGFNKNQNKIKKEMIDIVTNLSISHPSISYHFEYDNKVIINTVSSDSLSDRIEQLFSKNFLDSLIPIYHEEDDNKLEGYISGFQFYKSNSDHIHFFLNRRIITYPKLVKILKQVYGELIPPGRFPVAILFLEVLTHRVDVNVHPQKKEVRFQEESQMRQFFYRALKKGIESHSSLSFKHLANKKTKFISPSNNQEYKPIDFSIPLQISDHMNDEKKFHVTKESDKNKDEFQANSLPIKNSIFFSELTLHEKLYETFIVATSEKGIYLLDQHTIHERVNYEKFLLRLKKKKTTKQELLTPIPLQLSLAEQEITNQHRHILNQIGFELRELGPNEFGLVSVPFYVAHFKEEESFQICLKQILNKNELKLEALKTEELFNELAASLSCRASIKKGDPESLSLIKELIQELKRCEAPMRCPHGRPTIVFLGKEDISALFKRA